MLVKIEAYREIHLDGVLYTRTNENIQHKDKENCAVNSLSDCVYVQLLGKNLSLLDDTNLGSQSESQVQSKCVEFALNFLTCFRLTLF